VIKTANLTGSVSRRAGGLFESVRHLVQALVNRGLEVRVLSLADEFTVSDAPAWRGVTVKAFRPTWPKRFGYCPQYVRELMSFAPDVTHTHGLWQYQGVAMNRYYRRGGAPYIVSPHGMLDPWALRHSRWKKTVAYFLYEGPHLRSARCIRALCAAEARSVRQLGLKNPIAVIPNGVELPAAPIGARGPVRPWSVVPPSVLPSLERGRKVLLYLGRIHPKKGLVNLLKAWAAVQGAEVGRRRSEVGGRGAEWVLAMAGWDQDGHQDELKLLATERGIAWVEGGGRRTEDGGRRAEGGGWGADRVTDAAASVIFLGPQFNEDKTACYANCDALVLPSLSEGLPMVVLEAWAHAKPVLMTPECNLPEGFSAQAALRIESGVESIRRGLEELFQAPDPALQAMGQNGRTLVTKRFTWPEIAMDVQRVYEWMLGGGPKPGCMSEF
jgi:glycosyltransferase involved in cell wall biosynthesis